MSIYTHATTTDFFYTETCPLLDEEFDRVNAAAALDQPCVAAVHLGDDLAWDDQLDEGVEMSL